MREEPVVADGDADAGEEVAHDQDRDLLRPDEAVPEQRGGKEERDERETIPARLIVLCIRVMASSSLPDNQMSGD